jgi:hypothetical protein
MQQALLNPFLNDFTGPVHQLQTGHQSRDILFKPDIKMDWSPFFNCRIAALQLQT